jgi:hypothetical protein
MVVVSRHKDFSSESVYVSAVDPKKMVILMKFEQKVKKQTTDLKKLDNLNCIQ